MTPTDAQLAEKLLYLADLIEHGALNATLAPSGNDVRLAAARLSRGEISEAEVVAVAKSIMENNPVHGTTLKWEWWPIKSADLRPHYMLCARRAIAALEVAKARKEE